MSAEQKAGVTVGDVVKHLTERAREFAPIAAGQMASETHMNVYRGALPSRELTDAIVVSFVNYFAACYGMDLAFYTSDLPVDPPAESLAREIWKKR
jgi:hypothetical protein